MTNVSSVSKVSSVSASALPSSYSPSSDYATMLILLIAAETLSSSSLTHYEISSGGLILLNGHNKSSQGSKEELSEAPTSSQSWYSWD